MSKSMKERGTGSIQKVRIEAEKELVDF